MYQWLGALLTWLFFWGVTAAILVFDDRRAKAAAKHAGSVDFVDRRIRTYLGAAFFLGGFVLVLYFWSSRKSALGALLGVGALLATVLVTLIVSNVQSNIAFYLDHAATARACARVVEGTDGEECAYAAARFPDRLALLEIGCFAGGVTPCYFRGEELLQPENPQPMWRERARALCAKRPRSEARGFCDVVDVTLNQW